MMKRCMAFVETGEFPGRSLYWVAGEPTGTYDNRDSGLRVAFDATGPDNAYCVVFEDATVWTEEDRADAVEAALPIATHWIADMEKIAVGHVRRTDRSEDEHITEIVLSGAQEAEPQTNVTIAARGDTQLMVRLERKPLGPT